MKRKNKIPLLLCLAPLFLGAACANKTPEQPYNVLLIFSDDLNNWTSVMGGHPQVITPNIERLAQRSMIFTNAHCPSPACAPSRASIMTGYYPPTTGVFDNSGNFRETPGLSNTLTIPQYFSKHGYQTAAAGKIFHMPRGAEKEPMPLSDDVSWDEHYAGLVGTQAPIPFPQQTLNIPVNDYFSKNFVWGASPVPVEETYDYLLTQYTNDFLQKKHEKPFFMACGLFRPHLSWFAPQEFFDLYDLNNIILPEIKEDDLEDLPEAAIKMIKPLVHDALLEQGRWKEAVRAYLANISYADYCIGQLLDAIENSDYNDNTIIVLMGDHGWHLGEKEHWTKFTLWERSTLTTFMMSVPGMAPGRTHAPVNLNDLYPSLVDLCRLPEKKDLHGNSLTPLLMDPSTNWPYAALTWFGNEKNYAIKDAYWRYIRYEDGSEELYNHEMDPNEWYNLAGHEKYDKIIESLKEKGKKTYSFLN